MEAGTKIKKLKPLEEYKLYVEYDDGVNILYDLKWDFVMLLDFTDLKEIPGLFESVHIDEKGDNIVWREDLYLPIDIVYDYGKKCEKMQ
jgi:hypothetical protein